MITALSAEWLKLRSVRATYWLLGVALLALAGAAALCWYVAGVYDHADPAARAHISVAPMGALVASVTELLTGILGTLAVTSEYRTGTIRTSLAAVPRRGVLLASKALTVSAVSLVAGELTVFATYGLTGSIVGDRPILSQAGDLRGQAFLLAAQGLLVLVYALLGLSLGTLTRSAAATIPVLVLLWYVLPIVANLLPQPWHGRIGSVVPDALPGQLVGTDNPNSVYGALLPPWGAALAITAWVVVPLTVAAVAFHRRDVR